jgi:hypothetical protein
VQHGDWFEEVKGPHKSQQAQSSTAPTTRSSLLGRIIQSVRGSVSRSSSSTSGLRARRHQPAISEQEFEDEIVEEADERDFSGDLSANRANQQHELYRLLHLTQNLDPNFVRLILHQLNSNSSEDGNELDYDIELDTDDNEDSQEEPEGEDAMDEDDVWEDIGDDDDGAGEGDEDEDENENETEDDGTNTE